MTAETKKPINPLAEVTNPFAPQETRPSPYPTMSNADPAAKLLREVIDILFPPIPEHLSRDEKAKMTQAAADFAHAATEILTLIESRENRTTIDKALKVAKKYIGADDSRLIELQAAELDTLRKEQLLDLLLLACLACRSPQQTLHESIERQRNKIKDIRALIARKTIDANSKKTDALVEHHTRRLWRENRKRRGNASGTATALYNMGTLNEDLEKGGLKRLGKEAIRKRVRKIK